MGDESLQGIGHLLLVVPICRKSVTHQPGLFCYLSTWTIPIVKYTEYPEEKHFIADRVFTDAEFWKWLLAQKLAQ
jgi:hypothetical protein